MCSSFREYIYIYYVRNLVAQAAKDTAKKRFQGECIPADHYVSFNRRPFRRPFRFHCVNTNSSKVVSSFGHHQIHCVNKVTLTKKTGHGGRKEYRLWITWCDMTLCFSVHRPMIQFLDLELFGYSISILNLSLNPFAWLQWCRKNHVAVERFKNRHAPVPMNYLYA